MYAIAFLAAVSFLLTLFLTPVVRNLFRRYGVVDQPGGRKTHSHPIPQVGGVALLAAYGLAFALLMLAHFNAVGVIRGGLNLVTRLAPAVLIVFGIGLIDDIRGLKPWQKLMGESVAAGMAYFGGIHAESFARFNFPSWLGFPLTILWLVGCSNAMNLIDGVDGLASGVGLFAASTTLFAALITGHVALAIATAPLVGCLLGFLRYNFNPATIFLGDCGSLTIGFILGCFGVLWNEKAATILGMTAPLMALSIPLLDTALAIFRRFLRRRPFFLGDRGHIHHRLLDRGFTPRKVALILYVCCAFGATCSLLTLANKMPGFVVIVFCSLTWLGVQYLGYVEFGATGRMFLDGAFQRTLSSHVTLRGLEQELIAAPTPDRCWEVVSSACRNAGFHRIHMILAGQTFDWEDGVTSSNSWDIWIPISDQDSVHLTQSFGGGAQPNMIPALADLLKRCIVPKIPVFAAVSKMNAAKVDAFDPVVPKLPVAAVGQKGPGSPVPEETGASSNA